MYVCIFIDHQPQKDNPNRVRITAGSNLINYPFELTTCTTDMVSSKILWNSTISTKGARFAGADIKNMYLEMPLDQYEYMKMPLSLSLSPSSHRTLLNTTAFATKHVAVTSTWKFTIKCMAYHKPASWLTNFRRSALQDTTTLSNRILRAYGNMNPARFGSISQWMISGSSTLENTIPNTYMMHSGRKCTKLLKTALVISIVASTSIGIITNTMLT